MHQRIKGFIGLSKDDFLIKNLWAQLTANYTEEFDFVSGYHVATKNPSFTSFLQIVYMIIKVQLVVAGFLIASCSIN